MKSFLSVLLIVLLVPLALSSLWLHSIHGSLRVSSDLPSVVFSETALADLFVALGPMLDNAVLEEGQSPLLTANAWSSIKAELFDAPWLARELQAAAGGFLSWLHRETATLTLDIDISEKKDGLALVSDRALRDAYLHLPVCAPLAESSGCRIATETYDMFLQRSSDGISPVILFLREIPDHLDLLTVSAIDKPQEEQEHARANTVASFERVRSWYERAGSYQALLLGLEIAVLLGLAALHRHSVRSVLGWVGAACIAMGGIALAISSTLLAVVLGVLRQSLSQQKDLPTGILERVTTLLHEVFSSVIHSQRTIVVLLLLFGLLCCAVAIATRPRSNAGPIIIHH